MTHLLILLAMPEKVRARYFDRLKSAFPQIAIDSVDHHGKVDPYIAATDVLLTFAPMLAPRVIAAAKNLKWIQALGSGVDGIADHPDLRRETIVTRIHGIHEAAVSEAVIASMLALARDLPRTLRNQARHQWERWPVRLLDGKTVGILGVGVIAEGLAPRCKAMGMKVIGISSSQRQVPGIDLVRRREELLDAVKDLDYLVLLTPYSEATHHIAGPAMFAAMKKGSFIVNLARGGIVDEAALIAALKEGRIAGAALDVFTTEPLPQDHPFWSMPNVIVTAHLGGFYDEYPDRALPVVEANLHAFLAGDIDHMINLVGR